MVRLFSLGILALVLSGCGGRSGGTTELEDLTTREVTLANGQKIHAEVVFRQEDVMRGLMFRSSMAANHGMLFIHATNANYPYWTYQVKVPLDIVWLDLGHYVVEIAPDTPPCTAASARTCPTYGGHRPSSFVLELAGGVAAKQNIRIGDKIEF